MRYSVRDRLDASISVAFSEKDANKLKEISKRLDTSVAEVIRLCVQNDLPKLLDRETKRRKSPTN